MNNIKPIYEAILTDEDKEVILEIPLKDLIWTIVCYSNDMSDIEKEAFRNYPFIPRDKTEKDIDSLIQQREYKSCRRDELARLISKYTEFDTQKIWYELGKLFQEYRG